MKHIIITGDLIAAFLSHLISEEKSKNTVDKYIRDVTALSEHLDGGILTKEGVIAYKQHLIDKGYAPISINSMLASINSFVSFVGCENMKVKSMKVQRQVFCDESHELTKNEYDRLCRAAEKKQNIRLNLIIQTICATGIRVSELKYITTDAVKNGEAVVQLKGKTRTIIIVDGLKKKLLRYISERKIDSGCVFVTRNGKPIGRTNVWREMKHLCKSASVDPAKVFPHNLRHLFARMFYKAEKDIAKLADVLGHSSIETTRIYLISTCHEHRRLMERMRLVT